VSDQAQGAEKTESFAVLGTLFFLLNEWETGEDRGRKGGTSASYENANTMHYL